MTTIIQSRDRPRAKPVYLIEITLKNSGPTLYFSDRNIVVGAQRYENYVEEIQGLGEEIKRIDSTFLNIDITIVFKNERYKTYNYLVEIGDTYPFEGADCTIKEVYLDDSNNPSDAETILKCNLDELQEIDLLSFKCKCSSRIFQKDLNWKQEIIDTTVYPNAYEEIGKYEPIICGADILVPAIRIDWGIKTTLHADISDLATSLEICMYGERLASSGSVWIDEEKITYSSKSGNVLNGLTRGASGTTASVHSRGAEVWEHKTQYDSLIAEHLLYSVGNIYAEIQGLYCRVSSGASLVESSGKSLLRATSIINIKPAENIEVINQSHRHQVSETVTTDTLYLDYISSETSWIDETGITNAIDDNLSTYGDWDATEEGSNGHIYVRRDASYTLPAYNKITQTRLCIKAKRKNDFSVSCSWKGASFSNSDFPTESIVTVKKAANIDEGNLSEIYDMIDIVMSCGGTLAYIEVYEVWLEIDRVQGTNDGGYTIAKGGGLINTFYVDRFLAVVSGVKDDGSGTITGTPGALIERPDHQFKYWLVNRFGFSLANDIDAASFNTAGAWYASNTYKFAFRIDSKITPSEFLQKLAFECRSTIREIAGKWYLDVLPDTAPSASVTISQSDLAGKFSKITFDKTKKTDLANDLTAKFKRDYAGMLHDSDWLGTSSTSDSTSQTKYGIYAPQFEFEYIRLQAMSDSLLVHIKLQRKNILLTCRFPVFYEHFNLKKGDTFDISYPIYNAKKFYIEDFTRRDKGEAEIEAIEWW